MDKYFNSYREMISLCGLTDHTMKSLAIIADKPGQCYKHHIAL